MQYKNLFYSFFYLINLVFYVIALKSINYYFNIDNLFFSCIIFGEYFPLSLMYFFYNKNILEPINIIIGFLDYLQLIFLYIGINNLYVVEYLSYRTLSIIFNALLSYNYLSVQFNKYEIFGILIIGIICIILLCLGGIKNLLYSLIILGSSFMYSICNFLLEKYKENSNFTQIKFISSFLSLMTYTYYSLFSNSVYLDIHHKLNLVLILLLIFVGSSEYIYYYLKTELIKSTENGSVYINILDIIRRVITFIISIYIFNDKYEIYLYICYSILLLGCIIYNFSKYCEKLYLYIKNKFCSYYYFDENSENNLEIVEIK